MNNVALACTGGGVKSAIDIGVIRGLEELGIKIEAISGASLGSCVAIMYAMGFTPEEILIAYKENMKYFSKVIVKFGNPIFYDKKKMKDKNEVIKNSKKLMESIYSME